MAGGIALVEMAYHRQLDAVLGARFDFVGVALDVAEPVHWALATLLAALGALLMRGLLRRGGAASAPPVAENAP